MVNKPLPAWTANSGPRDSKTVSKGAIINVASGAVRLCASLSTAIVLGRLLTPEDFGLVNLVLPVVAFFLVFSDVGISSFILQREKLDHVQINRVFWFSATIISFVTLVFAMFAHPIALFYEQPKVVNIIYVLCIAIFLTVFTITNNAFVKKYNRQNYFAVAEIIASFFASLIPILMALKGAGYWSLVAIPVTRYALHALVITGFSRWFPSKPELEIEKYREILLFGSSMMLNRIIGVLSKNLDKIAIGYFYTTQDLGFYSMAVSIMLLPALQLMAPISGSLIPFFADKRDNIKQFESVVLASLTRIALIVIPLMLCVAIFSQEIISIVLGDRWLDASFYLSILSFVSMIFALDSIISWAVIATGKPKLLAKWAMINFLGTLTLVFTSARFLTVQAIPIALLVNSFIMHGVLGYLALTELQFSKLVYYKTLARLMLYAIAFSVPIFLIKQQMMENLNEYVQVGVLICYTIIAIPLCTTLMFGKKIVAESVMIFRKA